MKNNVEVKLGVIAVSVTVSSFHFLKDEERNLFKAISKRSWKVEIRQQLKTKGYAQAVEEANAAGCNALVVF